MSQKIELRDVTKVFHPDIMAVDRVSLMIEEGEFFSLLGPSGCGKTTLMRMIAGLETPESGEIWLDGKDILHVPPNKRNVNMVFQSYGIFPHMTVWENIAYGLKVKRIPKPQIIESVREIMQLVRLEGLETRKARQLSGGQQQRVALARAFVNYPAVLLLDEPLAALDQKLREEMEMELVQLQRRINITFVFVTHDQREAMTVSDRIAVMRNGRIEQIGTPQAIYESPATPFVADFIGKSNLLSGIYQQPSHGLHGIEVHGGTFWAASDETFTPGERVTLMVRPEKIRISGTPDASALNTLSGRIREMVYEGVNTRYFVNVTPNGTMFQVFLPNVLRTAHREFTVSAPVFLSIEPDNVVLMKGHGQGAGT